MRRYAGTYAVVFCANDDAVIATDARGLREVYYRTDHSSIICGSQPHLVARLGIPPAGMSTDPDLLEFYRSQLWDSRWVGDETAFAHVRHLLPNHILDLDTRRPIRFWPKAPITRVGLDDAVRETCQRLQNTLKAITRRHSCMMAVTAGTDSRTLLAASRDITREIYFFVNDHHLGSGSPDIRVPRRMLEGVGVPFHVHEVPDEVDENFRRVFLDNTFLASECLLPAIYNVFHKQHEEKVLILGVSEIGRTFYGEAPRTLTSHRMSVQTGVSDVPLRDAAVRGHAR